MGRERKRRRWRSARRNFALGRGRRLPPFAEQQYCPRGFSSRWRATIDAREWNAQLWAKRGPGDRNRQRAKKQGPQTQRFGTGPVLKISGPLDGPKVSVEKAG